MQSWGDSKFDMFIHNVDLHHSDIDIDDPKLLGDELQLSSQVFSMLQCMVCGTTMIMVQTCRQWAGRQRSHLVLRSTCHTQAEGRTRLIVPSRFGLPSL
mmetsp:Transcript_56881/g.113148  ORF Transcript_56881/g.113148 Transcript_56881/m.113148 type:complete len:99 (+) Transcript_56881:1431-1727(+)